MKSKSDAQLRFDRTLEALALVWAETIKQLSATQAELDAALAENEALRRVTDAAQELQEFLTYNVGMDKPELTRLRFLLVTLPPR